jgi:5-methylcytosine-specific restriction endonuclease McrA
VTLEFIPPTKRRGMTKARAARIFLDANGICCNCGRQIRQGEQWFVEHVVSLAQGGADDDKNGRPAHTACKAEKDATDAASKAKRDRLVTASWDNGSKPKMQSRGFQKAEKQRRATTALTPKFDGDIMALRADWSPAVLRKEEL